MNNFCSWVLQFSGEQKQTVWSDKSLLLEASSHCLSHHIPCVCALASVPLREWDDVVIFLPGVNRHGDMNIH